MSTPKFIHGPNFVQTSLYGYDRTKKVQVSNLRGRTIVVFRSENINERGKAQKNWVVRNRTSDNKPSYPSYAHFHHQYSSSKPSNNQSHQSTSYSSQLNDRNNELDHSSSKSNNNSSLKHFDSQIDQQNVRRLFDKLAISSCAFSPASSTSSSNNILNVSSDKTMLDLNPLFTTNLSKELKAFTSCDSSFSTSLSSSIHLGNEDPSFVINSPSNISCSQMSYESDASVSDYSKPSRCEIDEIEKNISDEEEKNDVSEEKKKTHICHDEVYCEVFHNGVCIDEEAEWYSALKWYDELIQWRHDVLMKKRIGPPRCHPPPLTVTMVGASRAQRANPFHRVGEIHPFAMDVMEHARSKIEAKRNQCLVPYELPLPAPHEFMANAKCMEPHLFIEYCYQLTAAAYVDIGLNPPNRRPPIPPAIEPFPEPSSHESICSSASDFSSDGEYSDDSEETKKERIRQKQERHKKRERRLQQIFKKRAVDCLKFDTIDEEVF